MRFSLQGNLRRFPPQQLFVLLGRHEHTGTLDVEAGGAHARLIFRDGAVQWGECAGEHDPARITATILGWHDASFTFADDVEMPPGTTPLALTVDELLREGARLALIARTFPDDARFGVVESQTAPQISLSSQQFKLLFRLGSGRSFADLLAEGGATREELADGLRTLEAAGLIARTGTTEPAPAPAAAAQAEAPPAQVSAPRILERKREPTRESAKPWTNEAGKPEVAKGPASNGRKRTGSLTEGGPDGAAHLLTDDAYTIGRIAGNDIVIADSSVSSKHARLTRTPEGFTLEDLGSRNGTYVNGEKIGKPVALADNDMVRIGKVILTFNLAQAQVPHADTTEHKKGRR